MTRTESSCKSSVNQSICVFVLILNLPIISLISHSLRPNATNLQKTPMDLYQKHQSEFTTLFKQNFLWFMTILVLTKNIMKQRSPHEKSNRLPLLCWKQPFQNEFHLCQSVAEHDFSLKVFSHDHQQRSVLAKVAARTFLRNKMHLRLCLDAFQVPALYELEKQRLNFAQKEVDLCTGQICSCRVRERAVLCWQPLAPVIQFRRLVHQSEMDEFYGQFPLAILTKKLEILSATNQDVYCFIYSAWSNLTTQSVSSM